MGNNLSVLLNGKVIAALARKHNFCFYGDNCLPTEDEIEKKLNNSRQHIISTLVGYATWLATQENPLTENIDDIVSSVKDLIELFEYDVMVAGRNWALQDLQYQLEEDIEVVDDNELYRRQEQDKKDDLAKKSYFNKLRKQLLIDKAIADAENKGVYDAVEHQTGEVDLEPEKNTLQEVIDARFVVDPEWEDKNDDYLDRQNRQ
jgi:hypothetical protein